MLAAAGHSPGVPPCAAALREVREKNEKLPTHHQLPFGATCKLRQLACAARALAAVLNKTCRASICLRARPTHHEQHGGECVCVLGDATLNEPCTAQPSPTIAHRRNSWRRTHVLMLRCCVIAYLTTPNTTLHHLHSNPSPVHLSNLDPRQHRLPFDLPSIINQSATSTATTGW